MESFMIFWGASSIVCYLMEIINELRIFKDAANYGYKIDIRKLLEMSRDDEKNNFLMTILPILIPFLNLIYIMIRTVNYNDTVDSLLCELDSMGVLKEMTEVEKNNYLRSMTIINALSISLENSTKKDENIMEMIIDNGSEKSKIFYKIDSENADFIICKVEGDAAKLSLEEQKKKVFDIWMNIYQSGIDEYGDDEKFISELTKNPSVNLKHRVDSDKKDVDVGDQISKLNRFREELINSKEDIEIKYTKKRKK